MAVTPESAAAHFSGKDPTKVDRSGAYAARYLAKHVVKEKLADKAEVRLAYFIGAKKPVMLDIETFGTEKMPLRVNQAIYVGDFRYFGGRNHRYPGFAKTDLPANQHLWTLRKTRIPLGKIAENYLLTAKNFRPILRLCKIKMS